MKVIEVPADPGVKNRYETERVRRRLWVDTFCAYMNNGLLVVKCEHHFGERLCMARRADSGTLEAAKCSCEECPRIVDDEGGEK